VSTVVASGLVGVGHDRATAAASHRSRTTVSGGQRVQDRRTGVRANRRHRSVAFRRRRPGVVAALPRHAATVGRRRIATAAAVAAATTRRAGGGGGGRGSPDFVGRLLFFRSF